MNSRELYPALAQFAETQTGDIAEQARLALDDLDRRERATKIALQAKLPWPGI